MNEAVEGHLSGRETFAPAFGLHLNSAQLDGSLFSHDHDFWELAIIESGTGCHSTGSGESRLERGSVLFLRPRAWHAYRECVALSVYNVCWSEAFGGRELSALGCDAALGARVQSWRFPSWRGEEVWQIEEARLETILTLWRRAVAASHRTESVAHTLLLLCELWRGCPLEANPTRAPHPAVATTAALLSNESERAWTLGELSRRSHVSGEHLSREFKRALGIPPMEYLLRERMERAAGLLLGGDESIARVALRVGYGDANFFARRFRAHFGVSPRDYRRRFTVARHRSADVRYCSAAVRQPSPAVSRSSTASGDWLRDDAFGLTGQELT